MSFSKINELIYLYQKYKNNPSKFDKNEIKLAVKLLTEIKYFKDLQSRIGYINIKELCLNMKILFYKEGTKVTTGNDIRTIFHFPLIGKTTITKQSSKKVSRFHTQEVKCLTDCYMAEFDSIKFVLITNGSISEKFKKFSTFITCFPPFKNLTQNEIEKLYLYYNSLSFEKGEYIFKEGEPINGIFFILKGEFLLVKQKLKENEESKLDQVERELRKLKKESAFYMFCLNRKYGYSSKDKNLTQSNVVTISPPKDNQKLMIQKKTTLYNPYELFGEFEFIHKISKRIFSVIANSNVNEVYFISNEKLEYCINKETKNALNEYCKKQKCILNKVYNNLRKVERSVAHSVKKNKEISLKTSNKIIKRNHSFDEEKNERKRMKFSQITMNFTKIPKLRINNIIPEISPPIIQRKKITKPLVTSENFFKTDIDNEKKNKNVPRFSLGKAEAECSQRKTSRHSRNTFLYTSKEWINNFYTERNNYMTRHNFLTVPSKTIENGGNTVSINKMLLNLNALKRNFFSPQK